MRRTDRPSFVQRHVYLTLLLALLFVLVATPLLEGAGLAAPMYTASMTVVFIAGTVANRSKKWVFRTALAIAILAVPTTWGLLFMQDVTLSFGQHLVVIAFCGVTGVMVLMSVVRDRLQPHRAVLGAVSVYLLIGLTWATIYETIEMVEPNAFRFAARRTIERPGDAREVQTRFSQFVYFSFVTMTTLGYGEIHPRTALAETACWLEAIIGQLFLVILIARLVAEIPVARAEDPASDRDAGG